MDAREGMAETTEQDPALKLYIKEITLDILTKMLYNRCGYQGGHSP
jgi:hypothetical protein